MKSLLRYLTNLSISKKFTTSLFFIIIVPLVTTFFFINKNITEYINAESCKTNLEVLKQTRTSVTNFIKDAEFVSLTVLGDYELQSFIKLYESESNDEVEKQEIDVKFNLQSLLDSRKYISELSVYNDEEIIFQFGNLVYEEDGIILDDITELKGRVLWTPAYLNQHYVDKRNKEFGVSVMRAINDLYLADQKLAYERITIKENSICSLYKGIATLGTKNMFIVNQNGDIVSSIDKTLLGENIANETYFKDIFKSEEGYFIKDNNTLLSYYNINSPKWSVVKVDELRYIYNKSELINLIILICASFTVLFGICFLYIQNKSIIRPVERLSKEVNEFKEGAYNISLHTVSKDEIGKLNEGFIQMGAYIQDLIERVYKSQIREKETQLKSLQSQINPHFLYNTLDAIRWMAIKEKQYDIADQVEALANLFKHSLNGGREITTIGEEIEHLKSYILIQKNRFGDNINIIIEADERLYSHKTLKLILQPLVENAIVHGLENKIGGGEINVRIEKCENNIRYIVRDNGLGADEDIIVERLKNSHQAHSVFALKNIDERIKCKYGEMYGIQFNSKVGVGTTIEVIIPLDAN